MPNVRGRNRRAAKDETLESTPRATGKKKAAATPGPHELLDTDANVKIPAPKFSALDGDDDDEDEQAVLQSRDAAAESTPLSVRLQKRALDALPGPSKLPKRQLYSPLPPSSPPSVSSEELEYENAPPIRVQALLTPEPSDAGDENFVERENKENEFAEDDDDDEHVLPVPTRGFEAELAPSEESSQDDPFGFTALERRLKSQREARRHSFEPLPEAQLLGKGKEPMRTRAPLGELSFDRDTSTSTLKDRHPTPYHESDDLEDMYLDPNELPVPELADDDEEDEHAHTSPQKGLERLEAEMDEEEQAELARELQRKIKDKAKEKAKSVERESSTSSIDPLRTPQPKHVANIYPLRSPFSSVEGTPCDRSLPDSPLSSPSPTKPMAVLHTLPVSSARKGMLSPAKTGPRPLVELPASKRRRITLGKENSLIFDSEKSEDPAVASKELEKLLPKRPAVRRSTRAAAAGTSANVKPRSSSLFKSSSPPKRGRGRPPKNPIRTTLDSSSVREVSDLEDPEASPVMTRKKRAATTVTSSTTKEPPVKKTRASVASPTAAPTTTRRGRPPKGTTTRSTGSTTKARKPASKGKGKGKAAKLQSKDLEYEAEDSDAARRRQERIEYFKRLDEISLEKEDVFVI